jgi:hypothetical protein
MEDPTATSPRNNATETPPRGRPFAPGNPGRPKGSRHRITRLVENLIKADGEAIAGAAIKRALDGDGALLRALLDRLAPPRRDRTIEVDLPKLGEASDATAITAALVDAVAEGTIAPGEAKAIGEVVDIHVRAVELREMAERVRRLEEAAKED